MNIQPAPCGKATTGTVVPLFSNAHPGTLYPQSGQAKRDRMTYAEVVRALCLDHYCRNETIISKLRSLHRHSSMPLPENPRFVKGKPVKGGNNICKSSIWLRTKFMSWKIGNYGDPDASPLAKQTSHSRMAMNAQRIAGQINSGSTA